MRSDKHLDKKAFEAEVKEGVISAADNMDLDPAYANRMFKVRYAKFDDLSNKTNGGNIPVPVDDPFDGISIGDVVKGETRLGRIVSGRVVSITRDSKGNGLEAKLMVNGKIKIITGAHVELLSDKGPVRGVRTVPPAPAIGTGDMSMGPLTPYTESRILSYELYSRLNESSPEIKNFSESPDAILVGRKTSLIKDMMDRYRYMNSDGTIHFFNKLGVHFASLYDQNTPYQSIRHDGSLNGFGLGNFRWPE
jgi:hypothetical protein